jgi:hypothetical protein
MRKLNRRSEMRGFSFQSGGNRARSLMLIHIDRSRGVTRMKQKVTVEAAGRAACRAGDDRGPLPD